MTETISDFPDVDPAYLAKLHARTLQVTQLIGAIFPSRFELCERMSDLVASGDPKNSFDQRRALTSVAARLAAVSHNVLGLLGEFDLELADRDDLARGLADRGVALPSVECRRSRRRRSRS